MSVFDELPNLILIYLKYTSNLDNAFVVLHIKCGICLQRPVNAGLSVQYLLGKSY